MPATKTNQSLSEYRSKRSQDQTPEPFTSEAAASGHRFVVQQHAARRLHYDFRLELDGVLLSWAVPKGPSPNPADKRLAVRTEDHPLDYANFEGNIPEGNYGAGSVIVWDRGIWRALEDPRRGLEQGKLLFDLTGYKLRGRWTLVKIKNEQKNWLLIKERDAYMLDAGTESYPKDSILSGLTVEQLKQRADHATPILKRLARLKAAQKKVPGRQVKVMLARPAAPFSKKGWLFEIKYDGYRLVIDKNQDQVRLYSRNGNDLTAVFPEIADAIRLLPYARLIMDGEAVVHDEHGLPSFGRLQRRGRLTRASDIKHAAVEFPATVYLFDLLSFGDYDLRSLPLVTRKQVLRNLLPTVGPIRYSDHIEEHGETMYAYVQEMGLEGVVAKKADSLYRGGRSPSWLKVPVEHTADFVVAGYTHPKGTQPGFGALLLAHYQAGKLRYAGRVGTGFKHAGRRQLYAELNRLPPDKPPAGAPQEPGMHWCEPALICEVKFKQVTADGVLRAPVFMRLRDDKDPEECVSQYLDHELPEPSPIAESDTRSIPFTNLDKVFWPDHGYTKGDLISYYRNVAHWMLPYLKDRPVVLTRYPDGISGKSFYQKDAPDYVPDWIRIERLWSAQTEREIGYFIAEDLESLLYLANMGSIPLHIWSSRIGSLETPDWCILDLDPKQAPFQHVVQIARAIHKLCEQIGLPNFVKTSGSTGLHILIPLATRFTYEQSRTLGELLARVVVNSLSDIATVARSPSKRQGKVYIDYLQNRHGQTIVSPLSVRPLPAAPVSMPLRWREVNSKLSNDRFTINNGVARMKRLKQDPLLPVLHTQTDLALALDKLEALF